MQSILHVLKVNEARAGTSAKTNKPWRMQDAECVLMNDDGTVGQVGVLQVPRDLIDKVQPGMYLGSFALRASLTDRRIEAILTALSPYAANTVTKKAA